MALRNAPQFIQNCSDTPFIIFSLFFFPQVIIYVPFHRNLHLNKLENFPQAPH